MEEQNQLQTVLGATEHARGEQDRVAPWPQGLAGWREGTSQRGGQGRPLSGEEASTGLQTARPHRRSKPPWGFGNRRRERQGHSPTPPKGSELRVKCMITSLAVTPPLDVPSIIRLTS